MQPTADFDASKLARSLLRRSRQGALATLRPENGDPYCSLVNVASQVDASPVLLISTLPDCLARCCGGAAKGRWQR
jgi:putative heme iron utilization protein